MSIRFLPHNYQIAGMQFVLENAHCGLFLRPGRGKTAMMLACIDILKKKNLPYKTLVVTTPRIATNVWPEEKNKFLDFMGLSMVVLHGPKKQILMDVASAADIVVVTQDGASEFLTASEPGHQTNLTRLHRDILIIDESSYYRHSNSNRFKRLRMDLTKFSRRVILTGTPAPRSYEDLWPQAYIMDRGTALEPFITRYRNKYFTNIGYDYPNWQLNPGAGELINKRLAPLVFHEDWATGFHMPQLQHNTIPVTLPATAMALYKKLEDHFYLALGNDEVMAPNAAVLGNKLRQVANGFVYTENGTTRLHNAKMVALEELLEGLAGEPALLLYEYDEDRDHILQLFPKVVSCLTGLSPKRGNDLIREFNEGKIPVLLAHPASAGHGLNLQGHCHNVIFYNPTWNLEHHDQGVARVWRQGNEAQSVIVHTIVAMQTKDLDVADVLRDKDHTQQSLLSALRRPKPQSIAVDRFAVRA